MIDIHGFIPQRVLPGVVREVIQYHINGVSIDRPTLDEVIGAIILPGLFI